MIDDDHSRFKKEYKINNELEQFVLSITSDLDLSEMPGVKLSESSIHGLGVFGDQFKKGNVIGYARLNGFRTILGRYANHAKECNAKPIKIGENILLYAIKNIYGKEITVNYRNMVDINKDVLNMEVA